MSVKKEINFFILMLLFFLAGCGRMSAPKSPEGATYPQAYQVEP